MSDQRLPFHTFGSPRSAPYVILGMSRSNARAFIRNLDQLWFPLDPRTPRPCSHFRVKTRWLEPQDLDFLRAFRQILPIDNEAVTRLWSVGLADHNQVLTATGIILKQILSRHPDYRFSPTEGVM